MEIIREPLTPLPLEEIERGRLKVSKGYPPPEHRLTFTPEVWNEMYHSGVIAIPDGPHHIVGHPGHTVDRVDLFDPPYTEDNPMPIDEIKMRRWMRLGVLLDPTGRRPALDTAKRPLHPRAPQMLTTLGMYTGTGYLRHNGPNPVGNFGLRVIRNGVIHYVTVGVDRGEVDEHGKPKLRYSLPGGHAEGKETAFQAAVIEFVQETGIEVSYLGRLALSAHIITPPHPFWKNTLHAFTAEQYFFGHSEDNPDLEGVILKTRDSDEVKRLQLMSLDEIRQHSDFLGAHRKQIEKHEQRLRKS